LDEKQIIPIKRSFAIALAYWICSL
jgi:hypothetical protein